MAKKKVTEENAPLGEPQPSSRYHLYRCGPGDEFPCCFCDARIADLGEYILIEVESDKPKLRRRRAHVSCMHKALSKLVEMRDRKGVSEDLGQM